MSAPALDQAATAAGLPLRRTRRRTWALDAAWTIIPAAILIVLAFMSASSWA